MTLSLLEILLVLPLVGAVGCALVPSGRAARNLALAASLACCALVAFMALPRATDVGGGIQVRQGMNWEAADLQFQETLAELPAVGVRFEIGVNTISFWLVALTVFLQPLAIAASFKSIRTREKQYYAWMMVLLTAMLGVFVANDAILFYVFFELTLVPMFFIIGIWGGPQRRYAAGKFFLFTFAGSVFTLAAIIYAGTQCGTFQINTLIAWFATKLTATERLWVTLGLLAGFAVKVPLFPVHTWLPLAHTEAPTAGSVILAGVLLKLGTYGILRLAVPAGFIVANNGDAALFPALLKLLGALCLVGIIYGALVAWVQQDIKKLVAYSSVSHLGFCVLGLAALNHEGIQGSVLYMINHGLSTGAMFLVIGMIYDRYHTRDINELSGLAKKMPVMAFFFVLFVLSSIGLPGLNGFASEFLTILGAFRSSHLGIGYGAVAALGIILGAVYMLHMTARVIWGPLKTPDAHEGHGHGEHAQPAAQQGTAGDEPLPRDLSAREIGILVPIALAVVILGVIPGKLLKTIEEPVSALIGQPRPPTAPAAAPAVAAAPGVAATEAAPAAPVLATGN